MANEKWEKIKEAFDATLRHKPDERAQFLDEVCRADETMRREVEALLSSFEDADSFMARPVVGKMPEAVAIQKTSLTKGQYLGHYEISEQIGAGGMGEVYRAHDAKLKRDVAIKILSMQFSRDPDRVSRFQREAEVLAALNHPNIAQIYGLEESEKTRCIVMELVEGETLQERLKRERISIEEAFLIAEQIAEALEAAHERGIIHRDLKPGNVMLTTDGKVKVLDFGLAKVFQEQQAATLSNAPTLVSGSVPGVILGTAAYMSPEQAKGKEADRTSDIWAFGCVMYEILTGQAAFEGETAGEILAGIVAEEPDWRLLPVETPLSIQRLVRRCLRKDRRERLQHIGDARIEINEVRTAPGVDGNLIHTVSRSRPWIPVLISITLIAAILFVWFARRAMEALPEVRFEFTTPPTSSGVSLAISPDGQEIVFAATLDGGPRLWLRSLNSTSTRPLPGTDGGFFPFWSPDSRSIGFFADGKLKRIDIDGGLVRVLAHAPNPLGGTWNREGTILFTPNYSGPIFRLSITGDEPAALTRIQTQQAGHRFPQFLPDGRHFLYYVPSSPEARGVYVGQLDGGATRRLFDADAPAVYRPPRHLLFVHQGKLIAQEFDPVKLESRGNPFPVAEQVVAVGDSNAVGLSASAVGPIVYRGGSAGGFQRQFVWFDRSGNQIRKVGDPDSAAPANMNLSPDGRRLAMSRTVNGNTDLWMLDLQSGLPSRFTFDMAADSAPVWSPDGNRLVFTSNRKGIYDLYQKPVTGGAREDGDLLLATQQNKAPVDWSPDRAFRRLSES